MKRSVWLLAGLVGLIVLMAVFLYPRPTAPPAQPEPATAAPPAEGSSAAAPRRGLLPARLPHERAAGEAAPEASDEAPAERLGGESSILADPEATALAGLELGPMDDGLREKLKIPASSQIGAGVVVKSIHPDSPAAEIFMRPNDVIVRADKKKVNSVEDLQRLTAGRDHTLLTVSRDGVLVQMVIKKPYRPKN